VAAFATAVALLASAATPALDVCARPAGIAGERGRVAGHTALGQEALAQGERFEVGLQRLWRQVLGGEMASPGGQQGSQRGAIGRELHRGAKNS
jgi:hypothetical protein